MYFYCSYVLLINYSDRINQKKQLNFNYPFPFFLNLQVLQALATTWCNGEFITLVIDTIEDT